MSYLDEEIKIDDVDEEEDLEEEDLDVPLDDDLLEEDDPISGEFEALSDEY